MSHESNGPQSVYASAARQLLSLRAPVPKERADAARNRVAVLDAAAAMFARDGVENVSMDAIAVAAGVGKGTLFRRFGDKAGLAAALLDARERVLQERILSGPPPLGPGEADSLAPPSGRVHAFVDAYLDYALDHLDLVRMSETAAPGARYRIGAYRFWRRHVAILLQASDPDVDADALSHTLLAALAGENLHAAVAEYGAARTRQAVHTVVAALVQSGCSA